MKGEDEFVEDARVFVRQLFHSVAIYFYYSSCQNLDFLKMLTSEFDK